MSKKTQQGKENNLLNELEFVRIKYNRRGKRAQRRVFVLAAKMDVDSSEGIGLDVNNLVDMSRFIELAIELTDENLLLTTPDHSLTLS